MWVFPMLSKFLDTEVFVEKLQTSNFKGMFPNSFKTLKVIFLRNKKYRVKLQYHLKDESFKKKNE